MSIESRMVKDVVHIYSGILFSHKKNEMSFAASKMDLEIGIQSEVRQINTNIRISFFMWNLKKMIQMNLSTKQK